ETAVSALRVMPAAEEAALVQGENQTAVAWDTTVCVHTLVARQVARTPTAVAVVSGAQTWTYAELAAEAAGVTAALQRAGVRRGALVAVLLPRGGAQVAAVLGILQAGAAYVPVELDWPVARQQAVLRQQG